MGIVACVAFFLYYQGTLTLTIYIALSAALVTVLAATIITAYVYRLSFIALTDE